MLKQEGTFPENRVWGKKKIKGVEVGLYVCGFQDKGESGQS